MSLTTTQDIIALQTEKINNDVVVKLYDYYDNIKFEEIQDKTFLHKTKQYNYGIVDKKTFEIKFALYMNFVVPIIEELNIRNYVFAGGSIFNILANYQTENMNNSDIDIFFFGENQEESILKFMNYTKKEYCAKLYRLGKSSVFEVQMPFHRKIQLIPTVYKTKEDIIKNFDLTYIKVMVDVDMNVYCTLSVLYSYKYWMCYVRKTTNQKLLSRCKKTLEKGMRLISHNENFNVEYKQVILTEITNLTNLIIEPDFVYFNSNESDIQEEHMEEQKTEINKISKDELCYVKTKSIEKYGGDIYYLMKKNMEDNCENSYYSSRNFTLEIKNVYYKCVDCDWYDQNRISVVFNKPNAEEKL